MNDKIRAHMALVDDYLTARAALINANDFYAIVEANRADNEARAAVENSAIALHAEHKPLFAEMIAQHPGLREEMLAKQPDDLHIAYMAGFADGKKARPTAEKSSVVEPVGEREPMSNDEIKRLFEALQANPKSANLTTQEHWFVAGTAMAEAHHGFARPSTKGLT